MTSLITEGGSMRRADASGASAYAWLLIALPLFGAAILLLGGGAPTGLGHCSAGCRGPPSSWRRRALQLLGPRAANAAMDLHLWNWIPAGAFQLDAGLLIDPLSMTFVLLITFVGSLIHVYSSATWSTAPTSGASSPTSTCSSRRCCCWCSRTPTSCCSSAGRAWAWRRTCSSGSGTGTRPRDRGEQGVLRQPGRRPRAGHRDHADVRHLRRASTSRPFRRASATPTRACSPRWA